VVNIKQFQELLKILNTKHRPIIPLKKDYLLEVNNLVFPSFNSWMPINLKKGIKCEPKDFLMSKNALEFIRYEVLKHTDFSFKEQKVNRRIFISRKNASNSRIINEDVILELFKKYDFEIVFPEELSFLEQVKLFTESKIIAGATGAAFTNIVYCKPSAKIICIIPKEYTFLAYSTIANLLKLEMTCINAKVHKQKQAISEEKYFVDVSYCEHALNHICCES
jgi:hypothetical protein